MCDEEHVCEEYIEYSMKENVETSSNLEHEGRRFSTQSSISDIDSTPVIEPGAVFVRGIADDLDHSNQAITENLPVAIEVYPQNQIPEFPFVHGELFVKKKSSVQHFSLVMITLTSILVLALSIEHFSKRQTTPNLIFSCCLTDYEKKLKEILIPISGKELLEDPNSAQYYSWKVVSNSFPFESQNKEYKLNETERVIQRYAAFLVGISLSSNFKNMFASSLINGKLKMPDECQAFVCNENGEITLLILKNNQYSGRGGGTISREIGALKSLTHLILPRNDLKGTIPTEIGNLDKLTTLDLQQNNIEGSIPSEVSGLKNLKWLYLQDNNFFHTIPTSFGMMTNLTYINLSMNSLNGYLPQVITEMGELKGIELYGNNISYSTELICDKPYQDIFFENEVYLGKSFWIEYEYTYKGYFGVTVDCFDIDDTSICPCCTCK